jgi:hypothetical protein
MATTGCIGPTTRSFVDARGNFALVDNFAQDDSALQDKFAQDNSLRFHLCNERVHIHIPLYVGVTEGFLA